MLGRFGVAVRRPELRTAVRALHKRSDSESGESGESDTEARVGKGEKERKARKEESADGDKAWCPTTPPHSPGQSLQQLSPASPQGAKL